MIAPAPLLAQIHPRIVTAGRGRTAGAAVEEVELALPVVADHEGVHVVLVDVGPLLEANPDDYSSTDVGYISLA